MKCIDQLHITTVKILAKLYAADFRINNFIALSHVPSINFGRQTGHSTALMLFIKNHPEKTFAVCSHSRALFKEQYGRLPNCIYLNTDTYNNVRGIIISYIVIEDLADSDTFRMHTIEKYIDAIRPMLQKDTLIVKLG